MMNVEYTNFTGNALKSCGMAAKIIFHCYFDVLAQLF